MKKVAEALEDQEVVQEAEQEADQEADREVDKEVDKEEDKEEEEEEIKMSYVIMDFFANDSCIKMDHVNSNINPKTKT